MTLSTATKKIIKRLEASSFEAFAVGGAVRDILMGRIPHDFDVATNAKTDEIKALFSDLFVIPTGEKHGTVTVICDGEQVEVTTFRVDGQYDDSRHPNAVTFVNNIAEDLSRRDLTINAIAYNERCGLVDPFGGVSDILAKTIRTVGDADRRFSEDALRILRCIRFAAVLRFSIDKETDDALARCFPLLKSISAERIFSELKLFLMGDFVDILNSHRYIFEFLFDGWKSPNDRLRLSDDDDVSIRFAYFFSGVERERARDYFNFLRSDNLTKNEVLDILDGLEHPKIESHKDALYFLSEYGYDTSVRIASLRGDEVEQSLIEGARDSCYNIDGLHINGSDIFALGYRGTEIGEAKRRLLHAVIEGEVDNERADLLKFLEQ